MGFPMIDFVVRECRAIIEGPMSMIRLGTCGTPDDSVTIGTIAVAANGSLFVQRNPDAWTDPNSSSHYYTFSKVVLPDKHLSDQLISNLTETVQGKVIPGLNATADSFYSSQGRTGTYFEDHNTKLIEEMTAKERVTTLEMETFHLFDLARCANNRMPIKVSAATIVLAQRKSNDFLDNATLHRLEKEAGEGCLRTLAQFDLSTFGHVMDDSDCVWNQ